MKKPISLLLLVLSLGFSKAQQIETDSLTLNVFLSAHPDDWQLFMNPNAYTAVKTGGPVLFLHTTAGDAGTGMGYDGYTLAREAGSLNAIRYMVNIANGGRGDGPHKATETVSIKGKSLRVFPYKNTWAYFMRLPDGNGNGSGYDIHQFKSLEKFYKGEVKDFHTVDSSATYKNKKDLVKTVSALVKKHYKKDHPLRFHIADTDSIRNPGDHSDHRHTSWLVQEVAKDFPKAELLLYKEYSSNQDPMNIVGQDFLVCAGTWGVTALGLTDFLHYSTWDSAHNSWIGRQYFTLIEAASKN